MSVVTFVVGSIQLKNVMVFVTTNLDNVSDEVISGWEHMKDDDYFDNDKDSYWNDTSAVYINSVEDISNKELEILKKLRIVY